MQASDELMGLMKTYAKMHMVENDVFSFTKSEYNQLEIVDTLSDDELQEVMEEILIEMSEEQDITEMVDALDALTITEVTNPAKVAALRAKNKASAAAGEGRGGDAGAAARAKLGKPAASSGPSRMDRMKSAAKKAGSAIKAGAKAAGKGAVRAAGYASGAAQRAASSAKSEFAKGRERGLKGSGSSSSSSSSSSDSSSASSYTPSSSGSSSSTKSSSSGSTRKAVGGALKSVGRVLKKGLKKGIGGAARAVSKGSDKLAKRMGEEAMAEADCIKKEKKTKHNCAKKVCSEQWGEGECIFGQHSEPDENGFVSHYDMLFSHGVEFNVPISEVTVVTEGSHGEEFHRYADSIDEAEVDEAMSSYDRNRKRAAQRAAARNAARDAGKTGVVPGVGYVTPRRERETYVDSSGTTRHKSGAKMPKKEEFELDENRRAARAAGGYKDDSKKQPDPSKAGFTGVGNMSIDAIRKMSARIDKEKKTKTEAVMGQDSEMRRAAAADRKRDAAKADKRQKGTKHSEGEGKNYADYQLHTSKYGKSSTTESSDEFEMLVDFLIGEGYSDSVEDAATMVSAMSESWITETLELCYIQEGMEEYLVVMGEADTYDEAQELMSEMDEETLDLLANQVQDIMDRDDLEEKRGLYANIHAKRKRGGTPAKPGSKNYPSDDAFEKAAKTAKEESVAVNKVIESMKQARKNVGAKTCWDGYKAKGTKMKNGRKVPNCVKEDEIGEEASDAMKDRRMERGGVDGNVNYKNPPKNNTNKFGSGKTMAQKEMEKKYGKGASAMDVVKAQIRAKYGKGSVK